MVRIWGLTVLLAFLVTNSVSAHAEPKKSFLGWQFGWSEAHWENQDFKPYIQNARHPHHSQWDDREWHVDMWDVKSGDDIDRLSDFFTVDILRSRYMDDDRPVLEVGPNFYRLGFYDQMRVVQLVDRVYGVTVPEGHGYFMLYDWQMKKPIGVYDAQGLQLQ